MNSRKIGLGVAGVIVLLAASARAVTYTMDELIVNGGLNPIVVGDTVYSDWGLSGPVDASSVSVTALMLDPQSYQLRFEGGFEDSFSADSPGSSDYRIYYSVSSVNGDPLLHSIEQSFNLSAQGAGGTIAIGETVFDNADHTGEAVAQSTIGYVYGLTDSSDPLGEAAQGDQLVIDPSLSKVWVTKDLSLYAAPDSYVGATIVYQGISGHASTSVPDGSSTVSLLGVALMGLAGVRRLLGC